MNGDFDWDGDVDDDDVESLLTNYVGSLDPSQIPEPTTMVLLAIGGLGAVLRKRKA